MRWHLIRNLSEYLPKEFDDEHFRF
ncbi:MAG: hypothetical protein AB2L26_07485 [Ignavibacteria bacterium]